MGKLLSLHIKAISDIFAHEGNDFWEYSLLTGPIQQRPQVLNPLKAELSLPGFCCLLEQSLAVCLQSVSKLLEPAEHCINGWEHPFKTTADKGTRHN